MKILIDPDKCIASGACVLAAPRLFDQDDDGIVVVLDETPDAALHDLARDAARACPAAVIEIEED